MHAWLYNFSYAEVGEVVTPGLAAKSSFRWPLRNHFLNKNVGTSSVVLAWVAPLCKTLLLKSPHHCILLNLGLLFNVRIFCTLLLDTLLHVTNQAARAKLSCTCPSITHHSPEYYILWYYSTPPSGFHNVSWPLTSNCKVWTMNPLVIWSKHQAFYSKPVICTYRWAICALTGG